MKTENWNQTGQKIITAVSFAYTDGGWFNLGSGLNAQEYRDEIPDDEPEIIISHIDEIMLEVGHTEDEETGNTIVTKKAFYVITDQHDNLIYKFPVEAMIASYSPLMGSYKKES